MHRRFPLALPLPVLFVAACGTEAPATSPGPLVFNEFNATGSPEWLEVAPTSDAEIDVSGYSVADTDQNSDLPKITEALKFPPGTKIPAGGRVLVLTNRKPASGGTLAPGPYRKEECLPGGSQPCFYAAFGVSASTGETVYVLDPAGKVVNKTAYPQSIVAGTTKKTVCRLPDRTGDFALCTATPGSANTP